MFDWITQHATDPVVTLSAIGLLAVVILGQEIDVRRRIRVAVKAEKKLALRAMNALAAMSLNTIIKLERDINTLKSGQSQPDKFDELMSTLFGGTPFKAHGSQPDILEIILGGAPPTSRRSSRPFSMADLHDALNRKRDSYADLAEKVHGRPGGGDGIDESEGEHTSGVGDGGTKLQDETSPYEAVGPRPYSSRSPRAG